MKIKRILNEQRIISPLTWHEFAVLTRFILQNDYAQRAIEEDVAFAKQLRKIISKLQTDFDQ